MRSLILALFAPAAILAMAAGEVSAAAPRVDAGTVKAGATSTTVAYRGRRAGHAVYRGRRGVYGSRAIYARRGGVYVGGTGYTGEEYYAGGTGGAVYRRGVYIGRGGVVAGRRGAVAGGRRYAARGRGIRRR